MECYNFYLLFFALFTSRWRCFWEASLSPFSYYSLVEVEVEVEDTIIKAKRIFAVFSVLVQICSKAFLQVSTNFSHSSARCLTGILQTHPTFQISRIWSQKLRRTQFQISVELGPPSQLWWWIPLNPFVSH